MLTKQTVSVNLDIEVIEYLDKKSEELGISRSGFVSMIINQYKDSQEVIKQLPELLEIMSDMNISLKDLLEEKK
jgi:metal-responsive CopG/Arc/MetJ family transcriptional regulator